MAAWCQGSGRTKAEDSMLDLARRSHRGDHGQTQVCGGAGVWEVSPGTPPTPGPVWLQQTDGLMPVFSEQTN